MSQSSNQTNEHDATWLLIPWYVNGRLGEQQRSDVDTHLRTCQACQDELQVQRQLCKAMAVSSVEIEQLPTASLRRLMQTIDAQDPASRGIPPQREKVTVIARLQQLISADSPRSLAASLALLAVLVSGVIAMSHIELTGKTPPANYYTVTSPAPLVASEVIRAVFVPSITVAEMQSILNEAQLNIVAGPTPAGVYSLAKTGTRTVSESLLHLRNHPQVLFAEPSMPDDMVAVK
jgi:anti-sigma factor RsiW